MARNRISGKTLTMTVGSESYECDLISAVLTRAEASDTADTVKTFCEQSSSASTLVWNLTVTAVQSTDTAAGSDGESLHTLIWDAAATSGGDTFACILKPHGNESPSVEQPHYNFTVKVDEGAYPDLGGEGGPDAFTFEYTFEVDGAVTRDTTP